MSNSFLDLNGLAHFKDKNDALYANKSELANLASKEGFYERMTVGQAERLLGNKSVPALFTRRQTNGGMPVGGGQALISQLKGKSLVWNQMVNTGVSEVATTSGHKYLTRINGTNAIITSAGAAVAISDATKDNVFDLTLMFGEGNEPSTVAEFEALYPLPYYAFNAGQIVNNKATALKTVGFNQWDEEWENGYYSTSGSPSASANAIRSKNYCPCLANTAYYVKNPQGFSNSRRILWYDGEKNFIGYNDLTPSSSGIVTSPVNATYFKVSFYGYGTTYNHDICINISDPSRNGTYEPYKTSTIELNIPTLTGKLNGEGESVTICADGLKSAGTAFDYGVVENGYLTKIVKNVVTVNMGTLTWSLVSGYDSVLQSAVLTDAAKDYSNAERRDGIISGRYTPSSASSVSYNNMDDKSVLRISASTGSRVAVKDTTYSDAATFKSAMSGVMLNYELAEPVTYILDTPILVLYDEDPLGTETRIPEDTSSAVLAPISMDIIYPIGAVETLQGLPKDYTSQASLDSLLSTLGTALNGTITKTWDATNGKWTFSFTPNS